MSGDREPERPEFDFIDILAFIIAAFQILLPILLGFVGIVLVLYLILRLLAS